VKHEKFFVSATGNPIRRALGSGTGILNQMTVRRHAKRAALSAFLVALLLGAGANGLAQGSGEIGSEGQVGVTQQATPFRVSNPKDQKWAVDEATRIYYSACDRVARSIRPVNPPHLHPSFVLVLGAQKNETVREGKVSEVRLKSWDPAAFAQAVVILAAREILSSEDVVHITRDALTYAEVSASVNDLRQEP
jgi:hypothetical protein